jgi:hypothetical protein
VTHSDGVADTFVKLYRSIITSSVWLEPLPVKVVWITMLASADWRGNVWASVKGLAHVAGVSTAECEHALKVLSSPDTDSRTKDREGRRIEAIDGGWTLINHSKYREFRTPTQVQTAERTRRYRARKGGVTSDDVTVRDAQIEIDKQIQREIKKQRKKNDLAPSARSGEEEVFAYWQERTGKKRAQLTDARKAILKARLREEPDGVEGLKLAVDGAVRDPFWNGSENGKQLWDFENIFVHQGRNRIETLQGKANGANMALIPRKPLLSEDPDVQAFLRGSMK